MLAPTRTSMPLSGNGTSRVAIRASARRSHLGDGGDAFHQHGELVAAQARHGVRGARGLDDALRHRLQQPVAGIVAERVVDVLEVVQVEEHDRDRALPALRERERVLHAVAEQVAVGEQRQRIVEGQLAQLLLERLALADVAEIQRQALHRRILREVAADALDHVALGAALDAQLHRADGARGRRGDLGQEYAAASRGPRPPTGPAGSCRRSPRASVRGCARRPARRSAACLRRPRS